MEMKEKVALSALSNNILVDSYGRSVETNLITRVSDNINAMEKVFELMQKDRINQSH